MTSLVIKGQGGMGVAQIKKVHERLEKESREIIGKASPVIKVIEDTTVGGPETLGRVERAVIDLTSRRREWTDWYDKGLGMMKDTLDGLIKSTKKVGVDKIKEAEALGRQKCEAYRTKEAQRIAEENRLRQLEAEKANEKLKKKPEAAPVIPKLKQAVEAVETKKGGINYATHREMVVIDTNKIDDKYWMLDLVTLRADALAADKKGEKLPKGVDVVDKINAVVRRSDASVENGRLF